MPRLIKKTSRKVGLPPGTLVHIGEKKGDKVKITIMDYDEARLEEKEAKTIEECLPFKDTPTVIWINMDGIHRMEIMEGIGKAFSLHPLLVEDVVNTEQRPKMEDFDDCVFVVLKMLSYDEKENEIKAEQISLVLGTNLVISFQEREGDVFDPIRERIRNGRGRIRKMGADYLAYALIDAVVDSYFIMLDKLEEKMEDIEEQLLLNPGPETLNAIHVLRRKMIFLRNKVWPLREVVAALERGESPLIHESTLIYLSDVYDNTIQVIETIEKFRDMLSGTIDIYLSMASNKMNEVMKLLAIIATIFMPLTFIAGIYGMNFRYMPELEWHWGYPVILLVMVAIGIPRKVTNCAFLGES
jgi:magnesium transporter